MFVYNLFSNYDRMTFFNSNRQTYKKSVFIFLDKFIFTTISKTKKTDIKQKNRHKTDIKQT